MYNNGLVQTEERNKVDTMRLVKFRSLANEEDLCRVIRTIKTGEFWCAKLWNMNDPMEGVFSSFNRTQVDGIFSEKNAFVICSFSDSSSLQWPLLWGYYANGFKGIAIEIEIDAHKILKHKKNGRLPPVEESEGAICDVKYLNWIKFNEDSRDSDVENIITRKLNSWKKEKEYRFLKRANEGWHKISEVRRVYIGDPYINVVNREQIIPQSKTIKQYLNYRGIVENVCERFGIEVLYSKIEGDNKVLLYPPSQSDGRN